MTVAALTDPALSPVAHGFFTRLGGVSTGAFASLNCSLSGKDDPDAVAENRARAAGWLGVGHAALVGLYQVHSADVAVLEEPWGIDARPRADAVVTRRRGLALGIVTADCAPVLFADAEAGVIGAAHAGWRGAFAGIIEATVAAMERLGAARGRIAASVGPCIRQPSYEVDEAFRAQFLAADPANARFFAPGARAGHVQFDLAGYCDDALAACGIARRGVVPADTLAEPGRFFSYRRATLAKEGPIGHQLSAIVLE
ncbi:peptidoglycan editing factor PgeF [Elioraea sp.]|uniref:peptidoglycan editing factor PgeF n=1 Tax=Elioraea sp. TaxID=2185103 RepID=UPI0025C28DE8|nr:peptidoglycan editing factor PgeF [Elioraea sp.]